MVNNAAVNYWISLKFCTEFKHTTVEVPLKFKVKRSKVSVTAWHNVSASIIAIIRARIRYRTSKLVRIISEPSAIRYTAFKVIRSNIEIAITPPRIARLRSNLVQSFITSQATHCKCSRSKVKVTGSRSQRKVMYEQHKLYNTAMDKFSDFKLGMAS